MPARHQVTNDRAASRDWRIARPATFLRSRPAFVVDRVSPLAGGVAACVRQGQSRAPRHRSPRLPLLRGCISEGTDASREARAQMQQLGRDCCSVGSAGGFRGPRGVADWSGVGSRRRMESGRGQAHPGPSHTTRHAGPHRAVRSAFPETAVGVGEPFQASGLVPVGVRQRALEWPGSGDAPVSLLRRRP